MKRLSAILVFLSLAVVCQAASPPPRPEPAIVVQAPQPALPLAEVVTLPGAEVTVVNGLLTIAYPQATLFAPGAVLPMPGGPEVLDPLADYLKTDPAARWDAKVMASTSNGSDYDLALAQKRSELLQRYLRNRGIAAGKIIWQAGSGEGIPLVLTRRPPQSPVGISSGVKE